MSEMVEIERDLEQARENLNRTLEEMNRKATSATELLPEQPIRRYPIASLCGALALGLAAGGLNCGRIWPWERDGPNDHQTRAFDSNRNITRTKRLLIH